MAQRKFKEPPTFWGRKDEDAIDWLENYENIGQYNQWGPDELRGNFWMYMDGTAKKWLKCLTVPARWDDAVGPPAVTGLRSTFLAEFQPEGYGRYQENKLRNRKQGAGESATDYYYDIMDLCRSVDPNMNETTKLGHLFRGLKPSLAKKLWIKRPPTCPEFLAEVKIHTEAEELAKPQDWSPLPVAALSTEGRKVTIRTPSAERNGKRATSIEPPKKQATEDIPQATVNAMILQTLKEIQTELVVLRVRGKSQERGRSPGRRRSRTEDGKPICFACGKVGHISKFCEARTSQTDGMNPVEDRSGLVGILRSHPADHSEDIPLLNINLKHLITEEVECNGTKLTAVIDTGAAVSVLAPALLKQLGLNLQDWSGPSVIMVNGQRAPFLGAVDLKISLSGMVAEGKAYVLDMDGIPLLLGNDFLRQFKRLEIRYGGGRPTLLLGELPIGLLGEVNNPGPKDLITTEGREIPARTLVPVEVQVTPPEKNGGDWLLHPSKKLAEKNGLSAGNVLLNGQLPIHRVLMLNMTEQKKYIYPGTVLGSIEPISEPPIPIEFPSEEPQPKKARLELNFEERINSELSEPAIPIEVPSEESQPKKARPGFNFEERISSKLGVRDKELLIELLERFEECFAKEDEELGLCRAAVHTIPLEETKPIRQPPYKSAWGERAVIQKHVEDMLARGVIEPSSSPWASPVVLATKKDGKLRFCVDYRRLNAVTQKDAYPLPRIEDTLIRLREAKIFTIMDLESGYWQVPVDFYDRPKTAFTTPDGLYQFLVMPFGLCSAPGTFQRMMDLVLAGLKWTSCLVYLDDIIIHAKDPAQHLERLEKVLTALQDANLKIKLAKCQFAEPEIKALGHVVNGDGIHPDPEKVKAVRDFPQPPEDANEAEKLKFVRSFVGLCSYYRRFIDKFAQMAKPLTDLTKKGVGFTWGPEQQTSFNLLKSAMTESLILTYPDYTVPFEIHPDACGYGIGAVLLQRIDGMERPLAYASRLMTTSELNYSITEKECLALVWAVKEKFRTFIWGHPIKIVTDHHALCWLMSKKDLAGRLARWSLALQEYQITIVHKSGRLHTDADALSRYPVDKGAELDDDIPWVLSTREENDDNKGIVLKEDQRKEWADEFGKIERREETKFSLIDNLLYRQKLTEHGSSLRLCLPSPWRNEILKACHDDISAGHMGQTRTLAKIQRRYYWKGMRQDITDYVRNCQSCQTRKGVYRKPAGLMENNQVELPFERVGMDILGPFPPSKSGNRYIVVAIDYVTKWAETEALPNGSAEQVANFFTKKVILRHGAPQHLTTDQGKCFLAEMFQKIIASFETNHRTTTAYHPQSNGQVERINHTLADMLSMYVSSDHSDWDEVLPFVTFAYNTSRQETTGRTPFYLMHGREAVLPIDVVMGINPNTLETDSEEVYQKLCKIRLEVNEKIAVAQEKAKARFDKNRRESENYTPGQKVLVYKPTRVVGKAEKLLHRWHGPYEVLVQSSPLNYLVHLPGKRKPQTEIVHVERLKAFHDDAPTAEATTIEVPPAFEQLPERPEREAVPRESSRTPTNSADVPLEPALDQPANRPGEAAEEINTEPDSERRYPKRMRKRRFALALPLLLGLMTVLQTVQAKEIIFSRGVIFKFEGEKAFSDSEWVVVTDISLIQANELISSLANWLSSKSDTIPSANKTDGARFHAILQENVRLRALDFKGRLEIIKERYNDLNEAIGIGTTRSKRGLIDGGGKVLNWLFGVSTTDELEKINKKVESMSTEMSSVVHSLSDHASLVNETLWEVKNTAETLQQLDRTCTRLDKEFDSLGWKLGNVVLETEKAWEASGRADEAFRAVENAIGWLDQFIENLGIGLIAVAMERLPPSLFPPMKLRTVLNEIKKAVPPGWSLAPSLQTGDLWKAYQDARVAAAAIQMGLRIFIHLPVYEFPLTFSLYRVISLPKSIKNGTWAGRYEPLPDYLAISSDRQSFLELSSEEARPCLVANGMVCPISRAINRKRSKQACAVAIFMEDDARIQRECSTKVTPWRGPETVYLGHRQWGFSAATPQQVVITCPNSRPFKTGQTLDLPSAGVFEIPTACSAQTDSWIFQASFKKDLVRSETRRKVPTLRRLDEAEEQWVTAPPQSSEEHQNLSTPIREILYRNSRAHQNLKKFEVDIIETKRMDEKRLNDANVNNRYPYELVVVLLLLFLTLGGSLAFLRSLEIAKRLELAGRVQALEERLALHERDVEIGEATSE